DATGTTATSTCTSGCSPTTATWSFATPSGTLGVSQPYTNNGLVITAYGFLNNGTATKLYGKNEGGDESGLGINGTVDNEIGNTNFVQLDLSQVIASGATSATMMIGSVQSGEGYNIYGSSTKGTLGTVLVSNGHTDQTAFAIPSYPAYPYISVRASVADVLVDAVSATSPGGCTITITGSTPPVITCPGDKQLQYGASTNPSNTGTATATCNSVGGATITYHDAAGAINCSGHAGIVRTWTATDACGNSASCTQNITYNCLPLQLSCSGGSGQTCTAFSGSLSVSGGSAPYKFSIVAGALPPGLTLNTNTGAITGTPTTAGSYTFTAGVTDATGTTATSTCTSGCSPTTATWSFATPSGTLGVSQPYTNDGLVITAYGFLNNGTATKLYGKNQGGDESGLGINGTVDDEIGNTNFVQLDLSQVIASGATSATIMIGSVQSGEGYNIYGSSTKGTLGTLLVSNGHTDQTAFAIPSYPAYPYISVRASVADVLVDAVSATSSPGCTITITASSSTDVSSGDTATIGFWQNKNGQAVIDCFNGGKNSTTLGSTLASYFPYLYGSHAGTNNLTGKSNAYIAALYENYFSASGPKVNAEMLATALASYTTISSFGGSCGASYGFNSSATGTAEKTYNVGANGSAIGLSNNTSYTVYALLQQANNEKQNGTFNSDATTFNAIFDGINNAGDIQ
ncbi:MAG TPA: putative Ig domain-containing protein, partial [Candidatus Saccharimonadales bacterium]|nr:putative Ig domain-containing protein [Candidatus Saccharimonadales bacterium]